MSNADWKFSPRQQTKGFAVPRLFSAPTGGQTWFEDQQESSREKAYYWTNKAADQGDFLAHQTLDIYTVEAMDSLANEFATALAEAEKGDVDAIAKTGVNLLQGLGVQRNVTEGLRWLEKALEHGNQDALTYNSLAHYYSRGDGVEKDEEKAQRFLLLSTKESIPAGIPLQAIENEAVEIPKDSKAMKLIDQIHLVLDESTKELHYTEITRTLEHRYPELGKTTQLEKRVYQTLDSAIRKDRKASSFVKVAMGTFWLKKHIQNQELVNADEKPLEPPAYGVASDPGLDFPSLRFSSPNLERISPESQMAAMTNLHLGARSAGTFDDLGIKTIGDFLDHVKAGLGKLKNFGKEAHGETVKATHSLSDSVTQDGTIDWLVYAQTRGFIILPDTDRSTMKDLLPIFPSILETAIQRNFNGPHWTIFQKRWLVPPDQRKTLEELGTVLNLTRSRTQQQEQMVFDALRSALLERNYSGLQFRFRPSVEELFRKTKWFFNEIGQTAWTKSAWLSEFADFSDLEGSEIEGLGDLMIELLSFHTRFPKIPEREPIVFEDACPDADIKKTLQVVQAIHDELRKECLGLDAIDLVTRLAKKESNRIHLNDLPAYIALCTTVEVVAGEIYRLKFSFLKSRADEAVRILADHGEPLSKEDIFRLINMQALKPLSDPIAIVGQMSIDKRISPIGKSGIWSLKEWGRETRTIPDVIEEILTKNGSPMEVAEITEKLQAHRTASPISIAMFLDMTRARFQKVARGFYGLTVWSKGEVPFPPRGKYHRTKPLLVDLITEKAIQILEAQPDRSLPLVELAKSLEVEFKINRNSIYGAISQVSEIDKIPFHDKPGKLCRLRADQSDSEVPTS